MCTAAARTWTGRASRASPAHTPQRSRRARTQVCASHACALPRTDAAGSALYLGAATAAGTAVTLVVHPIYLVKTRLQLQLHSSAAAAAAAAATATAAATAAAAAATAATGAAAAAPPLVPPAIRNDYRGMADAVARTLREEVSLAVTVARSLPRWRGSCARRACSPSTAASAPRSSSSPTARSRRDAQPAPRPGLGCCSCSA